MADRKKGYGGKVVYKTEGKRLARSFKSFKEKLYKLMHRPEAMQAKLINSVLRGHFNYYGLAGNTFSISKFHLKVIRYWRRILSRTSEVKYVSWHTMQNLQKEYKISKPRLKIPYRDLRKYVVV